MKITTKVTLLSLFVFPGFGHLFLKKYAIAVGFIASCLYLLLGLIKDLYTNIQKIIDSVLREDLSMDTSAISQALIDQGVLDNPNLSTTGYLLLFIWILAAFDAYRISKLSK